MGKQTGNPRGRPLGSKNKYPAAHVRERQEVMARLAAKAVEVLGADAFEGDAHALLMLIYKDTALPLETRIEAARAAIAYEKPKLANIEQRVSGEVVSYVMRAPDMITDSAEWQQKYAPKQTIQ